MPLVHLCTYPLFYPLFSNYFEYFRTFWIDFCTFFRKKWSTSSARGDIICVSPEWKKNVHKNCVFIQKYCKIQVKICQWTLFKPQVCNLGILSKLEVSRSDIIPWLNKIAFTAAKKQISTQFSVKIEIVHLLIL